MTYTTGGQPGVPGGFSGHLFTLHPKPVLYVTLIHLVKISKLVYFWRKVKINGTLVPLFLHPQQFDSYLTYSGNTKAFRQCKVASLQYIDFAFFPRRAKKGRSVVWFGLVGTNDRVSPV